MKRQLWILSFCCILLLGITGCGISSKEELENERVTFFYAHTFEDGKHIFFSLEVPYLIDGKKKDLGNAFLNNQITLDGFFDSLALDDTLKDGGSRLYRYDSENQTYGGTPFYVIACDSLDEIHDVFVAEKKEDLMDKCSLHIDDLEGVSMKIKENTLTETKATVIITDTSSRENVYGSSFFIEKQVDRVWTKLEPKEEMVFTDIGYERGEDYTIEFDISWENVYGKLPRGTYRIVKDTSYAGEGITHYITVEFEI